jgi:hypothetical protein
MMMVWNNLNLIKFIFLMDTLEQKCCRLFYKKTWIYNSIKQQLLSCIYLMIMLCFSFVLKTIKRKSC